jgi:hypothetical protein
VADCVADWYLTHASREQLQALLDGETGAAAEENAMPPQAEAAILDCLKDAT